MILLGLALIFLSFYLICASMSRNNNQRMERQRIEEERRTQVLYMRLIEERKKENEIRLYVEEQEMR